MGNDVIDAMLGKAGEVGGIRRQKKDVEALLGWRTRVVTVSLNIP